LLLTCALGPDCAGTLLTRFLEESAVSLDAAVYEVGPAYRWAFARASRQGVAVRLLLDGHSSDGNAATVDAVVTSGGGCRLARRVHGLSHWKLLVADSDRIAVGTGNLIWRDAPRDPRGRLPPAADLLSGTREWWAFACGAARLRRLAREHFEAAWGQAGRPMPAAPDQAPAGQPPPGSVGTPPRQSAPLRVQVPEGRVTLLVGGAAIATSLAERLATARRRALVTAPYVGATDASTRSLLALLAAARRRGVDARLLLGAPPSLPEADALAGYELPVAVMDPVRCTRGHAKGAVLDDTVLVGSANWSASGLGGNHEAALLVAEERAAAYYAGSLLADWSLASPPGLGRRSTVSGAPGQGMLGVA
jgi:phosphatidylserine/phosphatidylglycerophosphate/cardiolipin synthase-like enzyme